MAGEIVPIAKPVGKDKVDGLLAEWNGDVFLKYSAFRTSLPCSTQEDRMQIYKMAESDCEKAENWINREFLVSDYICHHSWKTSESGEQIPFVRTILLGPNQVPIAFGAMTAFEFVQATADLTPGKPGWDPPLKVKLMRVAHKPPYSVYKFKYDMPNKTK